MTTNEQQEKDVNDLFADTQVENSIIIRHKGNDWEFRYRNLTWREKYEALEKAYVYFTFKDKNGKDVSDVKYTPTNYFIACLCLMITSSPFPVVSEAILNSLDIAVMDQLVSICPAMNSDAVDKEVKKE